MNNYELAKVSPRFEVLNAATEDKAQIFMYGTINSYSWSDSISSKQVKQALSEVSAKEVHVHINSPGGDVFESIAIHNLLKNHDAEIIIHVDGLAASGASIIAMAGDKIVMPSNTMMMIHRAATYCFANAEGLKKIASKLEKIDASVTASYKTRFIGDSEDLETLLSDETWFTAEECVALGLADEVVDEIELPKEEEEAPKISNKEKVLNKYKNTVDENKEVPVEKKVDGHQIVASFLNAFQMSTAK